MTASISMKQGCQVHYCIGRLEPGAGGDQGRYGSAEGGGGVRDPQRYALRPLQEGRHRAQQGNTGKVSQ